MIQRLKLMELSSASLTDKNYFRRIVREPILICDICDKEFADLEDFIACSCKCSDNEDYIVDAIDKVHTITNNASRDAITPSECGDCGKLFWDKKYKGKFLLKQHQKVMGNGKCLKKYIMSKINDLSVKDLNRLKHIIDT